MEQRFEQLKTSLLKPIDEAKQQIHNVSNELETKQLELEENKLQLSLKLSQVSEKCKNENVRKHAKLFQDWDLMSCLELTGDWKDGVEAGVEIGTHSLNIIKFVTQNSKEIFRACHQTNVFKILPCYLNGFKVLAIDIIRLWPVVVDLGKVAKNMEKDFNSCLSIPYSIKNKLEKKIEKCKNE